MHKPIKILLILAGLFISVVMVSLIPGGVVLRERPMIRWSELENIEKLTDQLNPYLFPLMNQYNITLFDKNASPFSSQLFINLKNGIKNDSLRDKLNLQNSIVLSEKTFIIYVESISQDDFKIRCQKKDQVACLGLKAQKKFSSKKRDQSKIWVNMFRLNQTSAALFYFHP